MATNKYKPTSPGIRFQSHASFQDITKTTPEKALTKGKPKTGGRNSKGRITSRFIGGGHKQKYRDIDFKRDKRGIPAKVAAIEYDPNRTAHIALLHYVDGEKRYIPAPNGLDRKSTRLNSSHSQISYAVFCLKKNQANAWLTNTRSSLVPAPPPRRSTLFPYTTALPIYFKRDKRGIPAKVAAIEYDPNRTAHIALLHYVDGEKRYILAPNG